MSSAYSTLRAWSSSDVKEAIDTAPAHLDARNITIDFYLEEHCQRVLHEVKLTVPKCIDASKAFADDYLAAGRGTEPSGSCSSVADQRPRRHSCSD
jgi:hypothetical protein